MDATTTRKIAGTFRAIAREYQGSASRAGLSLGVSKSRAYGRTRYMLSYVSPTRSGVLAIYDATDSELYVMRPTAYGVEAMDFPHVTIDRIVRETFLVDYLLDVTPKVHIHSLTMEDIVTYRD